MRAGWLMVGMVGVWLIGMLCGCEEQRPAPLPVRAGQPVTIAREYGGQQGPFTERALLVVRRPEAWQALWDGHAAPRVDWDKETVLVALMGRQPTAGYAIEIIDVRATETRITMYVQETRPRADEVVAQVITYPYYMVVIPKTALPVDVAIEGQAPPIVIQESYLGQYSQAETVRTIVIREPDPWRDLWRAGIGAEAPPFTAERDMAVGIFLGRRPTAGYAVEIASVTTNDERVTVHYRTRAPRPDEIVAQVQTSPYALAIIPVTPMPVTFRDVTPVPEEQLGVR